jgi:coenzyme F420 biosynthesis associated uncharacterized protein
VQFTGVPWMAGYFRELVQTTMKAVDPSPGALLDALRRAVDELRAGRNPLDEGGLVALLASPEQQASLQKVSGLMSLLEGHGDVTMDRAGADRIPSASRFSNVLHARRQQAAPIAKFVQKLVGLEAKMNQYEQGERFIAAIEAAGGPQLFARVWEGPELLPSAAEIREPKLWIDRVSTTKQAIA